MRVLHLIDEPWDSGLTHYALRLSLHLTAAGHASAVAVRRGKKPEERARAMGLDVLPFDGAAQLRRALRSREWDVVNAHTGRMHTFAVIHRLLAGGRKAGYAVVRTRGDARPLSVHPLIRFLYRRTEAVIAASDHIRAQYESELGAGGEFARTVYPSVDPRPDGPLPPEARIGILGRLDPVKGHAIFIGAAAHVLSQAPEARFAVAGREANVAADLLRNQARELGIEDRVAFVGFHPSSTEFMASCRVGVIASIGSEEVSRACLEWMACGRPVVGTLVGSLPELIETQETGFLVPPGDSLALGDAILGLLKRPDDAARMGRRALEVAAARYSPSAQVERTLDVYRFALARRRGTAG